MYYRPRKKVFKHKIRYKKGCIPIHGLTKAGVVILKQLAWEEGLSFHAYINKLLDENLKRMESDPEFKEHILNRCKERL